MEKTCISELLVQIKELSDSSLCKVNLLILG